jgi:hypothetical protein
MKSRIFLSCGQRKNEIQVAQRIRKMVTARRFDLYIAIDVQSIFEINSGIIRELKNSDFYLFVNFRREEVCAGQFRGSLFSHQEFAIAYALGFKRILVVNQRGAKREGMLRYFGCNTEEFDHDKDCLAVVERALIRAKWKSGYSRRLQAGRTRVSKKLRYANSDTGIDIKGYMVCLEVHNMRPDIAALETTGRLLSYRPNHSAREIRPKFRSALKAAGRPRFSHTIFPRSREAFDLLCVGESAHTPCEQHVYLNTALDLTPTPHLKIANGTSELTYEFYSIDFPVLTVVIELTWPKKGRPSARVLRQETS